MELGSKKVKSTAGEETSPTGSRRRKSRRGLASPTPINGSLSAGNETDLNQYRPPDKPVHTSQDSLFSSSSGYTNYRGFLNLALLLLVLSTTRVALENMIKYGVLIDPIQWTQIYFNQPTRLPNVLLLTISHGFILTALVMEKLLARGTIGNYIAVVLYSILLTTILVLPVYVIIDMKPNPIPTSSTLGIYVCIFCKLISYGHVNYWCREARMKSPKKKPISAKMIQYPDNLAIKNIYYFICAPTLCYELNFPRSPGRRKWFLIKRIVEFIFLAGVILALCQQWVIPLLKNSIEPFTDMDIGRMLERLLKLAIPNHVIWLIFFYFIFHSALNLTAELLRFADREFYRDWWNSETVSYFWQNWNIPVHRWAVRHIFKPMLRANFSSFQAAIAVFFVSAFFHEYLISVSLLMFRLWAFCGMLGQIPLSIFTAKILKGGKAGNIVVWLSLILGQPLCILMYVHDYYIIHYVNNTDIIFT